jgi:hypothetical protein
MRLANAFCRFIELAAGGDGEVVANPADVARPDYEILTLDLV